MKQSIIMQYQTTYQQAWDAVLIALENCTYAITDVFHGRGEIQFHPRFTLFLPEKRLDLSVHLFDWQDGRIDLDFIYESPFNINMETFGGKYAGRLFYEVDKILGSGKLIQGTLLQPGIRNEMKRVLLVLGIAVLGIAISTIILVFRK
jgi:hypothetical protein